MSLPDRRPADTFRLYADWQDGAHYAPLLEVDRAGWAWEWLRRNPDYAGEAPNARVSSTRFGRAEVTIIRNADSGEGARWGLTFCRVPHPARDVGTVGMGCRQRRFRPECRGSWSILFR